MSKQLAFLLVLLELVHAVPALAARKDFKGLFGSYRREKFVENEGRSTDFGMDIMLSTLMPISSVVSSTEDRTQPTTSMSASTFFNFEMNFFMSLNYNWEIFLGLGFYNYETRRQNAQFQDNERPIFHQFEMDAIPGIFGIKYRMSNDDIVPYFGAGVGISYVRRKGFYDYSPELDEEFSTPITFEVLAGVEFYFASRAGIRLEAAAYNFRLAQRTFDLGVTSLPVIQYEGSPWMVRYASGVFFLF